MLGQYDSCLLVLGLLAEDDQGQAVLDLLEQRAREAGIAQQLLDVLVLVLKVVEGVEGLVLEALLVAEELSELALSSEVHILFSI